MENNIKNERKPYRIDNYKVCTLCNKNYLNYKGDELFLKESKCCYICNCLVRDILTTITFYKNKK